jgi:hypothetical protein
MNTAHRWIMCVGAGLILGAFAEACHPIGAAAEVNPETCYRQVTRPSDCTTLCRIPKIDCFVGVPAVKQEAVCGYALTQRKLETLFRRTVECGVVVWGFCPSMLPFAAVDAIRAGIDTLPPEKKETR